MLYREEISQLWVQGAFTVNTAAVCVEKPIVRNELFTDSGAAAISADQKSALLCGPICEEDLKVAFSNLVMSETFVEVNRVLDISHPKSPRSTVYGKVSPSDM